MNKYEIAYKMNEEAIVDYYQGVKAACDPALEPIKELVVRATPMKKGNYYSNGYWCYVCGCTKNKKHVQFSSHKHNFCPKCGQAIDWEGTHE